MSLYLAWLMLNCRPGLQGLEVCVLVGGDPNSTVNQNHSCCPLSYFLGHLNQSTQGSETVRMGVQEPVSLLTLRGCWPIHTSFVLGKWAKQQ